MKKILIIVDTSRITGRDILKGAEKYISAFTRWQVNTLTPDYLTGSFDIGIDNLDLNKYDGFFICNTKKISRFLSIKKPMVIHHTPEENLSNTTCVVTDSKKIANMAAEHFLSKGFKHFGFCGFNNLSWSQNRYESYCNKLKKHNFDKIYEYSDSPTTKLSNEYDRLSNWLIKLPKPIAIFACNDDRAIYILEACKSNNINVPEQVAVLGVDNDEIVCNLSSPPLSSISLDFISSGYAAAQQLDMLTQNKTKHKVIKIEPTEIITRKSTDIMAIQDKHVIAAMTYIRTHFHEPIQVQDVVNVTGISRREMEYRFKEILDRTIKEQIDKFRVEYIKKRLANSTEPIYKIASSLKFTDQEHFSRYFKNLVGTSPSVFRKGKIVN